jgi:hypothetical protein
MNPPTGVPEAAHAQHLAQAEKEKRRARNRRKRDRQRIRAGKKPLESFMAASIRKYGGSK